MVFAVLLAVVLLTQPKSDTATPVGGVTAATSTPNADATKLQIINLPSGDTVNKLVITELSQAGAVLTTTAASTTLSAPSPTLTVTSTPTPFVGATPGQPRKLNLNYLPAPLNAWKVAGQPDFALDSSQVDAAVQQLSNLQGTAALPADAANNLAQYGLDKPSLTIMLESSKGGSKTLDVGSLNGVTQNYWVKLESDNRVWTLSASTIDAFKGWLNTPPQLPPTPTAAPTTIGASTTISGTEGASSAISGTSTTGGVSTPGGTATPASINATTTVVGTVSPGGATTGAVTTSVSETTPVSPTITTSVATTVPSAATPTITITPVADTPAATATSK